MGLAVRHEAARSRYVLLDDDLPIGVADYVERDGALVFHHTEVEPARRGHGLGAVLVRGALDDVRARGATIVPTCWFVAEFVDLHPEYAELLAHGPGARGGSG